MMVNLDKYSHPNNRNFCKDAYKHTSCDHELAKDEVWIGNTSGNDRWASGVDIPTHLQHLKTIRLGKQAYCVEGKPLSRDYCLPLIISESDHDEYNKIIYSRMKGRQL